MNQSFGFGGFFCSIAGNDLVKKLKKYGYSITQTGSHMRLTTNIIGEHHITIPAHNPLKVGTFNNIVKNISLYLNISKEVLIDNLF